MRSLSRSSKSDRAWHRVELSLYRRCRQGNPEALRTLLYRLGDYWYTVTLLACEDEKDAAEALTGAWSMLLRRLCSWHMGGKLDWHGERILRQKLMQHVDEQAVRQAFEQTRQMDADSLISVPEGLAGTLMTAADEAADSIRDAAVTRTKIERGLAWALGTAVVITLILTGWTVWITSRVENMELVWECLQDRVVERDLDGAVRDAMAQISATGTIEGDNEKTLEKAGLILEEITNAQKQASARMIGYLSERSRADHLAGRVQEIADSFPPRMRTELMRAALILEEVENW